MKTIHQRRKELKALGLPNQVILEISLDIGAAYLYLKEKSVPPLSIDYTIPDLGPTKCINIDIANNGEIWGLEDISSLTRSVINNWINAIKLVNNRLKLKQTNPEKYFARFGHKLHFSKEDNKASCGEINAYVMTNDLIKFKKTSNKNQVCLRCIKQIP